MAVGCVLLHCLLSAVARWRPFAWPVWQGALPFSPEIFVVSASYVALLGLPVQIRLWSVDGSLNDNAV